MRLGYRGGGIVERTKTSSPTPTFLSFYNGGCLSPLGENNPYKLKGSRVNPLWPQCGSAVSNPQPPGVNRGPIVQLSYP